MLVIGLTGGIGSGKTTVANLFAKRGAKIIDTDQLSRDLTTPGQPALAKITDFFGPSIIKRNGSLNRATLRKIIFADEKKRRWLEELLHPLIRAEIKHQVDTTSAPYCIIVIPLLFETEPNPLIDRILVVDTTTEQQLLRTKQRDGVAPDEIQAILNTQVDREKRLAAADDIIENHGSIDNLEEQVEKLHQFYRGVRHAP